MISEEEWFKNKNEIKMLEDLIRILKEDIKEHRFWLKRAQNDCNALDWQNYKCRKEEIEREEISITYHKNMKNEDKYKLAQLKKITGDDLIYNPYPLINIDDK